CVLERLAAVRRAAIVDAEDDPALLDQIFVQRIDPGAGRLPAGAWAAIDIDEDRVAPAGHARRREHAVVKLGTVGGRDRTKGRRHMGGGEGRIRMAPVKPVLLDPSEALAGSVGEIDLRRLARTGAGDERSRALVVLPRIVPPAA